MDASELRNRALTLACECANLDSNAEATLVRARAYLDFLRDSDPEEKKTEPSTTAGPDSAP
jgi:hypothetical protein